MSDFLVHRHGWHVRRVRGGVVTPTYLPPDWEQPDTKTLLLKAAAVLIPAGVALATLFVMWLDSMGQL